MLTQRRHELIVLVGRTLLATIFIASGLNKIPNWEPTLGYMASQGIPLAPLFLFGAIFIEVLGGFAILVGFKARLGAMALFLYLIPVTLIFHSFWTYTGMEQQTQLANFMKNLSIMGGLLITVAFGPGALSIDHRIAHRKIVSLAGERQRIKSVS